VVHPGMFVSETDFHGVSKSVEDVIGLTELFRQIVSDVDMIVLSLRPNVLLVDLTGLLCDKWRRSVRGSGLAVRGPDQEGKVNIPGGASASTNPLVDLPTRPGPHHTKPRERGVMLPFSSFLLSSLFLSTRCRCVRLAGCTIYSVSSQAGKWVEGRGKLSANLLGQPSPAIAFLRDAAGSWWSGVRWVR
jgi:hypothetical protein